MIYYVRAPAQGGGGGGHSVWDKNRKYRVVNQAMFWQVLDKFLASFSNLITELNNFWKEQFFVLAFIEFMSSSINAKVVSSLFRAAFCSKFCSSDIF